MGSDLGLEFGWRSRWLCAGVQMEVWIGKWRAGWASGGVGFYDGEGDGRIMMSEEDEFMGCLA